MSHIITSLCLRDNGCSDVCPVECITAGDPASQWPTYYVDPSTCIDCGACVPECPYKAIYPEDEVPGTFHAKGGEFVNSLEYNGSYKGVDHAGKTVVLQTVRQLQKGETVDLRPSIKANYNFYK